VGCSLQIQKEGVPSILAPRLSSPFLSRDSGFRQVDWRPPIVNDSQDVSCLYGRPRSLVKSVTTLYMGEVRQSGLPAERDEEATVYQ
jgi:hypothetical protein